MTQYFLFVTKNIIGIKYLSLLLYHLNLLIDYFPLLLTLLHPEVSEHSLNSCYVEYDFNAFELQENNRKYIGFIDGLLLKMYMKQRFFCIIIIVNLPNNRNYDAALFFDGVHLGFHVINPQFNFKVIVSLDQVKQYLIEFNHESLFNTLSLPC